MDEEKYIELSNEYSAVQNALSSERDRVLSIRKDLVLHARKSALRNKDYQRPYLTNNENEILKSLPKEEVFNYKDKELYDSTCITATCYIARESGINMPIIPGNWTFRNRAKEFGFEKVLNNTKPISGDFGQLVYMGNPHHSFIVGEENGSDQNIYYEPGSAGPYRENTFKNYFGKRIRAGQKDNLSGEGTVDYFRYVGDIPMLKKKVSEIYSKLNNSDFDKSSLYLKRKELSLTHNYNLK